MANTWPAHPQYHTVAFSFPKWRMLQRKWWRVRAKKQTNKQRKTKSDHQWNNLRLPRRGVGEVVDWTELKTNNNYKKFWPSLFAHGDKGANQKSNETKQTWLISHIWSDWLFYQGQGYRPQEWSILLDLGASFKLAAPNHNTIKAYLPPSLDFSAIFIGPLVRIYLLVLSSCSNLSSISLLFLFLLVKQPLLHLWWKELFISWWQWPTK